MSSSPLRRSSVAARVAVLFSVIVLLCVPALTRAGQKLETASRTPSLAKNVDCPPKKVTIATVPVASPTPSTTAEVVMPIAPAPSADAPLPRSPLLAVPRPLRAPPLPAFA